MNNTLRCITSFRELSHKRNIIQLFAKQTHYILVDCQKSVIKHYKLDKQLKCDSEEKLFGQFIIQNLFSQMNKNMTFSLRLGNNNKTNQHQYIYTIQTQN